MRAHSPNVGGERIKHEHLCLGDRGGRRFCLRPLTAAANVPPYYPPIQEHVRAAMHVLGVYNGSIINRHTNTPYRKGHKGKLAKGQQSLNQTFIERQRGTF